VAATAIATAAETLTERPRGEGSAPKLFESGSVASGDAGARTLEDVVLDVWEDLAMKGGADCPVCGGTLDRARGCSGCGAELG
jgi:hypothetical protein